MKLAEGDEVVGVRICREGGTVLTVTENGKGRRLTSTPTASPPAAARASATTTPPRTRWQPSRSWTTSTMCC
ncbi:MAG: hypothetical protein ACLT5P_06700 [Flavonifractor plautii]